MKIVLDENQRARINGLGLVNATSKSQRNRGYRAYVDPQTGAKYIFSPRGYLWRRSTAGTYQLNPRFTVPGAFLGRKVVSATVRTNDAGALTEILVNGVKNFRD